MHNSNTDFNLTIPLAPIVQDEEHAWCQPRAFVRSMIDMASANAAQSVFALCSRSHANHFPFIMMTRGRNCRLNQCYVDALSRAPGNKLCGIYMKVDEQYIVELFKKRYGIELEKINESDEKTPDFIMKYDSLSIAVVEQKTFTPEIQSIENGFIDIGNGILEKESNDNGPARVARKIKEAYKQLVTEDLPKILIFFNKDSMLDKFDLEECYQGFLYYSNSDIQYKNVVSMKIANGDIKEIKGKIDLYIWVDNDEEDKTVFRYTTRIGKELCDRYFKEKDITIAST